MQMVTLFENKLRIHLPDSLKQVQESEEVKVFPYKERPQIIFASPDCSRFLTFSLLDKELGEGETIRAAKGLRNLILSIHPNSLLSKAGALRFGSLSCCGFRYLTGAGEAQVFNTMFAGSFEGKLLLGTYGCGIGDEEGKALLKKIIAEVVVVGIKK